MSLPFSLTLPLWAARETSLTSSYIALVEAFPVAYFGQLKLTVYAAAFSGSIVFESSADGIHWFNVPSVRSDTDAALTAGLVDLQPTFATETGSRVLLVPGGPWPYFRVVMTRTEGAITGVLQGFQHDNGLV